MDINEDTVELVYTFLEKPTQKQTDAFKAINKACLEFSKVILANAPQCSERTLALRDIQRARMMANSAIALEG